MDPGSEHGDNPSYGDLRSNIIETIQGTSDIADAVKVVLDQLQ